MIKLWDAGMEAKWYKEAKRFAKETTIPTDFNEKKATCKMQSLYILLPFLLITIALLIAVSIYYYLINYLAEQKNLSPFHVTNNELKNSNIHV